VVEITCVFYFGIMFLIILTLIGPVLATSAYLSLNDSSEIISKKKKKEGLTLSSSFLSLLIDLEEIDD